MKPAPKTYAVKSFGCQMNVYDGDRMAELMAAQGLTQAEIARRLGVSVTTVENHVRTALQRLAWARSGR